MKNSLQIPFANQTDIGDKEISVLAGDVGGTKTNLAFYKVSKKSLELVLEKSYHSASYPNLVDIVLLFLQENKLPKPDRICAGVAGPIMHGKAEITNLTWVIEIDEIIKKTGVADVFLLNDLEATAYGLAGLTKDDIITLHEGDTSIKGNMAIIAPGTGLGEAGLFWDGKAYHPFPTEGGHCDFCPRTDLDLELFKFLQKKYGIVSWEKAVAGPGIHDIYLFLRQKRNIEEPKWLTELINKNDPSAVISQTALENKDATCLEAMRLFVKYLSRESANLALKMKSTGGLFLGGGIPPKIVPLLIKDAFYKDYIDCDRMQHLLQQVPIHVITNEKTAMIGAAWFGGMC